MSSRGSFVRPSVRRAVSGFLALVCCWLAAGLFWTLLGYNVSPSAAHTLSPAPVGAISARLVNAPTQEIDTGLLSRTDLFSRRLSNGVSAPEASAPETQLNLLLKGIRQIKGGTGSAIIKLPSGGDRSFRTGDEITPGVRLLDVKSDHVILSRRGVRESLYFVNAKGRNTAPKASPDILTNDLSETNGPNQTIILQDRQTLETLLRATRMTPEHTKEGLIKGWRLASTSRPAILENARLEIGDLLKGVNNYDLTSTDQLQELIDDLATLPSVTLHIKREDAALSLTYSFSR